MIEENRKPFFQSRLANSPATRSCDASGYSFSFLLFLLLSIITKGRLTEEGEEKGLVFRALFLGPTGDPSLGGIRQTLREKAPFFYLRQKTYKAGEKYKPK